MGLKNLIKQPKEEVAPSPNDAAALAFISGAPVTAAPESKPKKKKGPTFVRCTFSLSKDFNRQIEKMSLIPRTFRATRSDVIRAGILALQGLEKSEQLALLERASKAEPLLDIEQNE